MIQSKALSFVLRYGIILVIGFALGIRVGYLSHTCDSGPRTGSGEAYVAPQAPEIAGVAEILPEKIVVLKPSQREIKKIEKKLGSALPTGEIASVTVLNKLPYGGIAVISLEPVDLQGSKAAQLTVYPSKRPIFEWVNSKELSAYYGIGRDLQGVWSLEYRQDLFMTWSATWNVKVGATQFPAGNTGSLAATRVEPYAMIGVSVKF